MNLSSSKDEVVTRDERGGSKRQIESGGAIWLTLSFRLKSKQQPATKTFLTGWGNEMFTVRGLMLISRSTMDYITTNIVRCLQSHRDFFIFPPASIFVQIKHCHDFSVSGQTARARSWVIAAGEAFYVSQFLSQWKSTCFYKSSPLRNTCTEQQAHCFPLRYIVKIERHERQHQAGLLNHSSFLAPLGWLNSSCQKHSIMSDVGLEIL